MKVSKTENPLFDRTEIDFEWNFEKMPTRKEIRDALQKALVCDPELLVVVKTRIKAGTHIMVGHAHLYKSAEAMKRYELPHRLKRNFGGGE